MHAEDIGLSPKYVMHDRDRKFTREFDEIVKSVGGCLPMGIQRPLMTKLEDDGYFVWAAIRCKQLLRQLGQTGGSDEFVRTE
jgi:hypothetical protein